MNTAIQCVEFAKTHFTESEARAWLEKHKHRVGLVARMPQALRYTQRVASLFEDASLVQVSHSPGITITVGRLRAQPVSLVTERRKCEPSLLGATAAAGRFLVFKEGQIKTDYGISIMTPKAGREVVRRFRERGNDMMVDLRHFSISPTATREQSEAMGWIPCPNGLEYVDGDGLYAVGVQWTAEVLAGLKASPPTWKYFSPYYDQDKKTKVITELLNVALTNMPATHGISRLAAERGTGMDLVQMGKALQAAIAMADAGDPNAVACRDALIAALGDQAEAALDAAKGAAGGGEAVVDDYADVMAAMSEDEKTTVAEMTEEKAMGYKMGRRASMQTTAAAAEPAKDKEETAAEATTEETAATVAAGRLSAQDLLLMARGTENKTASDRQRIIAEHKHLIPEALRKVVADPKEVSDKALAEYIAARKAETKHVTVTTGKQIPHKAPETRGDGERISIAAEAEAKKIAAKTGTDHKAILAEIMAAQRAEKADLKALAN